MVMVMVIVDGEADAGAPAGASSVICHLCGIIDPVSDLHGRGDGCHRPRGPSPCMRPWQNHTGGDALAG